MSELNIDLLQDQQTTRNAIDLNNRDIELISKDGTNEIPEDITEIRKEVLNKENPQEILEETLEKTIQKEEEKLVVDENIEKTNSAYKEYCEAVNKLPAGLLDNINRTYMALERSIAAIPKDLLFKFTKGFEYIDDDIPKIFLNPNDFGSSNYSFIIEKFKIYYEFFNTIPSQMVTNLLKAYEEYSNYYKMIPVNLIDYLISSYKDYKKCLSYLPPETIKNMGFDKVDSIFLDRVILYEENMDFLLKDIGEEEIINNTRYGITNDTHVIDGHFIVIPTISREDFVSIINQTGSLDRANELCERNIEVVYKSIERVSETIKRDNAILSNIKANMEISTMFIGLPSKNKEIILKLIDDQMARRNEFVGNIMGDMKSGWNSLEGQIGIPLDDIDDSDSFNKLERIAEYAKNYQKKTNDLMSLQQIINLIKENGYNIK